MTTISTLAVRKCVSTHWQQKVKPMHVLAGVVVLSLAVIPLADSAVQHGLPGAGTISPVAAHPAPDQGADTVAETLPPPQARPATPDRDIAALAAVVANSYRVSPDATLQLV